MAIIEQYKTVLLPHAAGDFGKLLQTNFKTLADLNEVCNSNIQSVSGSVYAESQIRAASDELLNSAIYNETLNRNNALITLQSAILPTAITYGPDNVADNILVPLLEADVSPFLQITIKVPDSGKLLIELNGYVDATNKIYWGISDGTTTYGLQAVINMIFQGNAHYMYVISDLTPGEIKTLSWRHIADAPGNTHYNDGSNGYFSTMKVTPIQ